MTSVVVGCQGKLPAHGDFIRMVGAHSPVEVLDAWLGTAGLEQPARRVIFDSAGPAFAIICTQGHWWGCALFPSQDRVGRRYPFIVYAGIPVGEVADAAYLTITAFLPFFMRAWQMAQHGWPADQAVLRAGLPNLCPPIDLAAEERRFVAAFDGITIGEVAAGLLGSPTDPRAAAVLADLLAVADGELPAGGVRFLPMAHQHHLGFWLMMLTLCGTKPIVPSVITLRFAHAGSLPAATLFLDRPEAGACLASLWPNLAPRGATAPHDVVAQAGAVASGVSTVDPAWLAPDLFLRDLLHMVTSTVRSRRTQRITRRPATS